MKLQASKNPDELNFKKPRKGFHDNNPYIYKKFCGAVSVLRCGCGFGCGSVFAVAVFAVIVTVSVRFLRLRFLRLLSRFRFFRLRFLRLLVRFRFSVRFLLTPSFLDHRSTFNKGALLKVPGIHQIENETNTG
ncbi:hypothetical protein LXL04_038027 [Taraxacum kok-saghyz]